MSTLRPVEPSGISFRRERLGTPPPGEQSTGLVAGPPRRQQRGRQLGRAGGRCPTTLDDPCRPRSGPPRHRACPPPDGRRAARYPPGAPQGRLPVDQGAGLGATSHCRSTRSRPRRPPRPTRRNPPRNSSPPGVWPDSSATAPRSDTSSRTAGVAARPTAVAVPPDRAAECEANLWTCRGDSRSIASAATGNVCPVRTESEPVTEPFGVTVVTGCALELVRQIICCVPSAPVW